MAEDRIAFFAGHAFTDKKLDDFREAINEAALASPKLNLKAIYADEVLGTGHIFEKIKVLILRSMFCIFDITENDRPNIYFELGFAHGVRKPHFLTCQDGAKIPSDLAGFEFLPYRSYKDLREKLKAKIPEMASIAFHASPKTAIGHVDLLRPVLTRLSQSRVTTEELISIAQSAGFTKGDLMQSIHHRIRSQVIGTEEEKLFLRSEGKTFVKAFFETYEDKS